MPLIDLSHPVHNGQPSFPGDPELEFTFVKTVDDDGCNVSRLTMSSHHGTHLDAPYHFYNDGVPIHRMALDRFIGPATVVDLAPGGALPARTPLTVDHFTPFADRFVPGARVLYRTGWDHTFGTETFYTDHPTLTLDAARWIADRRIGLLGMDTPTPSFDWLECHLILLARGVEIVIVESLTHLDQLPASFTFIGFPLNLKDRDGSPIRAVALTD
jgi:kynurenine formamidase